MSSPAEQVAERHRISAVPVAAFPSPMRARILSAASQLTVSSGWGSVTMARLADEVGVSRQTLYNEVGAKPALAEALVFDELGRILSLVEKAFDDNPIELIDAIEAAACAVLEHGQNDTPLHAIVSATYGADSEILPLLTTHAEGLLALAQAVIETRLAAYETPNDDMLTAAMIDMVVRVVLSHLMQPGAAPAETASRIAMVARCVVGCWSV